MVSVWSICLHAWYFFLHLVDFLVSEACMFFSVYLPTLGHPSVEKKALNFMGGVPSNNIPRKHPPARILVGLYKDW